MSPGRIYTRLPPKLVTRPKVRATKTATKVEAPKTVTKTSRKQLQQEWIRKLRRNKERKELKKRLAKARKEMVERLKKTPPDDIVA